MRCNRSAHERSSPRTHGTEESERQLTAAAAGAGAGALCCVRVAGTLDEDLCRVGGGRGDSDSGDGGGVSGWVV